MNKGKKERRIKKEKDGNKDRKRKDNKKEQTNE